MTTPQHILDGAPEGAKFYIICSDGILYFKYRWGKVFKWNEDFKKFVLFKIKCNLEDIAKPL